MLLLLVLFINSVAGESETAPYQVLKEHDGWEEREFPTTKWISTKVVSKEGVQDSPEHSKAFRKLFNYIDGQNSQGLKIPMTTPVTEKIFLSDSGSNFTMSFYIPSNLQNNPPLPKDSTVFIEERAANKVVSKRFGGRPDDAEYSIQAEELYLLAVRAGLDVSIIPRWTAGYDAPDVVNNRRNEVWLQIRSS
ncbi:heme-binding protein 1 isoform X2 [Eurytemora carolleeae]|uniref:heme-binding protein 1 isoform X2 n=1 Tax=Eurytemora carolleeae TaxID=1294199 RepID=UPI000C75C529|nr:heme-binding protein 1 isoform X2 [Eurytemora carolleeae]|eukprot:XP_023347631.1 heme-binding protein 1-like isoform X2 [Eurytemora affinis]